MNRPKILIVDDNEKNIFALECILENIGAEFIHATSGNDALKAILNHDFALALLDVQMPTMSGYELAEHIRGEKRTHSLPIIFLSAIFTDKRHVFEGYEAGAVDFITKPFDPVIFRSKVSVFLELYRQKEELQKRAIQLEASNRELESFAHRVSHELKNNILVIKRINELAEKSPGLVAESSALIAESTDKLILFVERMLLLSRSGRAIAEKKTVAIPPIVKNVFERVCPAGLEGKLVISEPCCDVQGDPLAMEEVFSNLLSNSVKHRDPGKERLEVKVESLRKPGAVEIALSDNGQGIPSEHLTRIFDAIFTTNEREGFGFGLAIVKRIVEAHGGSIRAESDGKGKGVTFIITLPYKSDLQAQSCTSGKLP